MQKIVLVLVCLWLPLNAAANVSAETAAKIKAFTRAEVQRQTAASGAALVPGSGASVRTELNAIATRLSILEQSATYYTGYKRQRYAAVMLKFQKDVAAACCPLNVGALMKNKSWIQPKPGRNKGRRGRGKDGLMPRPAK